MSVLRLDWNPDGRKLRQFGWGIFVFSALVATMSFWKGRPEPARNILAAGIVLATATLASPALGLWIYKAWMCAAFLIGTVMSILVLLLIYYGMMTPMALIFRMRGRDALRLGRREAESYWQELDIPEDKTYYERLF